MDGGRQPNEETGGTLLDAGTKEAWQLQCVMEGAQQLQTGTERARRPQFEGAWRFQAGMKETRRLQAGTVGAQRL